MGNDTNNCPVYAMYGSDECIRASCAKRRTLLACNRGKDKAKMHSVQNLLASGITGVFGVIGLVLEYTIIGGLIACAAGSAVILIIGLISGDL